MVTYGVGGFSISPHKNIYKHLILLSVMKKRVEISWFDLFLIKVAVVLGTFWLIGFLAKTWPFQILLFMIEKQWIFFSLAIIIGVVPAWKALYGARSLKTGKIKPAKKRGKRK